MLRRVGHGLALLGVAVFVEIPLALLTVWVLLGSGIGVIPLFSPMVSVVRWLAEHTRRVVGRWCDVEIDRPYHPKPPAPAPQPDGWYRFGRMLYRNPRLPSWAVRWRWQFTDPATWRDFAWLLLDPVARLLLAAPLLVIPGIGLRVYGWWAASLLGPTRASRLAQRMQRLARVHSQTADSQAAEIRRLERDLHDGTQSRLVALGMTLGGAEDLFDGSPQAAKELLGKARDTAAEALAELRRVVSGINPPVLTERGLGDAIRALAMDSPMHVRVHVHLPKRLPISAESAAYFTISELLANAAKHAQAQHVLVEISHNGRELQMSVTDDGIGGVDPAKGTGLAGIQRRLAAFDGLVLFTSPPGGPTTVTTTIPDPGPGPLPAGQRMPWWKTGIVVAGWSLGWLPLFPQGLAPAVFLALDLHGKAWFLPLYLPGSARWPTIVAMTCLGVLMYVAAIWLPLQHSRARLSRDLALMSPDKSGI